MLTRLSLFLQVEPKNPVVGCIDDTNSNVSHIRDVYMPYVVLFDIIFSLNIY